MTERDTILSGMSEIELAMFMEIGGVVPQCVWRRRALKARHALDRERALQIELREYARATRAEAREGAAA